VTREVVHDGVASFHVRFPFDRRLVDLVKSLPRRRFMPVEKLWTVPDDDIVALVELLQPEGFTFDETARTRYATMGGARPLRSPSSPAPVEGGDSDQYSVGRLNREVKAVLAAAFPNAIWLVGEISGFNRSRHKKHVGFSLIERDTAGVQAFQVQAILFDGVRSEIERKLAAAGHPFQIEDEVEVRVRVRVDLYDAWGSYRVQIEDLDVAYTLGEAARRREEILRKLAAEGLLERNALLPFPALPLRLGLITSLGSDAYHDVLRTLTESGFAFRVTAHGARVQGRATESSILNALDWFRARQAHFDAILICRGGGSRTDLAWFDSIALGRAVALYPIPILCGIGHEQDVSVLDHVARHAKTPTAAAAYVVEAVRSALQRVEDAAAAIVDEAIALLATETRNRRDATGRLARATTRCLEVARARLSASARQVGLAARRDLAVEARRVREASRGLAPRATRALSGEGERVDLRARRLYLLDPRRVVERGYAILRGTDGRVVVDPAQTRTGARVSAELKGGRLGLVVEGANDEQG
jgi:exodeoxyribonuclease VII large subunit